MTHRNMVRITVRRHSAEILLNVHYIKQKNDGTAKHGTRKGYNSGLKFKVHAKTSSKTIRSLRRNHVNIEIRFYCKLP